MTAAAPPTIPLPSAAPCARGRTRAQLGAVLPFALSVTMTLRRLPLPDSELPASHARKIARLMPRD